MLVWRLCMAKHAQFDGEGARLAGGRWNRRGTPMVYTSATLSMAVLEYLVNHPDFSTVPADLIAISADIPKTVRIETVELAGLPSGWREYPAPDTLAELGTEWARHRRSFVLSVPSAIVPQERNYLINPGHPGFRKIKIGKPKRFSLDPRFRKSDS